jgi:1-acyl-sn-glycerol-3-phosphate acyltransferase
VVVKGETNIFGWLRGAATLLLAACFLITVDVVQRTLVVVFIKARPGWREGILTRWVRFVNRGVMDLVGRVGGAKMELRARIPSSPGILVLMNHQSLLDIPVAIDSVKGGYPKIVARERYRSGYPLISHMIRLYEHPTVRPGEHAAVQLESLKKMAREAERAVVIYPEGSRTPDGRIRRFKKAGLESILSARPWSVYLLVADGMYESAGLRGFVRNISRSVIKTESEGPFSSDGGEGDFEAFIASMEERMIRKLEEMRAPTVSVL